MKVASIVRTVQPGTICSHRVGRVEVQFLTDYRPCLLTHQNDKCVWVKTAGRDWPETVRQAEQLASTFNNCCYIAGIRYSVEEVEEESPDRAPTEQMLKDCFA